jgi:sigma-E factor negative regulatory protein RseC
MTGRVRAISGSLITVEPERPAGCFGCLNQECAGGFTPVTAVNADNLALVPGQLVETGAGKRSLLAQGAAALAPPLVGFIAGFFLSGAIFPRAAEGLRAACGTALLFAAAAGFYYFRRRFPPKNTLRIIAAGARACLRME